MRSLRLKVRPASFSYTNPRPSVTVGSLEAIENVYRELRKVTLSCPYVLGLPRWGVYPAAGREDCYGMRMKASYIGELFVDCSGYPVKALKGGNS